MLTSNCFRFLSTGFLILILAAGCQSGFKPCPYADSGAPEANAGCLVTRGDDVLVVTMRLTGKQSLPGGTTDPGESPQCTAYRETLEETGVAVKVKELLAEMPNGFQLFRCEAIKENPLLNTHDWKEVSDVSWRSWLSLDQENWRYPQWFEQTRSLIRENITGISKQL